MNEKSRQCMQRGMQLEKEQTERFVKYGWDAVNEGGISSSSRYADITLFCGGQLYGYVETKVNLDIHNLDSRWLQSTRYFINELKPKLFILTNGLVYDIYFYGNYWGMLTLPPTPEEIDVLLKEVQ